jgi:hypothetical protein
MTHTMPFWLRRFFLQILPPLLLMESPKLREKQLEYERSSMNNTEQIVTLENLYHRLDETTSGDRKYINQVLFYTISWIIKV